MKHLGPESLLGSLSWGWAVLVDCS